jgi:acyl phosphate:glycerol-3-phosphate acyltransferase
MENFFSNSNIQFYLMAYLVGSIPFGYIISYHFARIRITQFGSGSIGATNVLRVLRQHNHDHAKTLAAFTLMLDVSKGMLLILIARMIGLSEQTQWAIAVLSVIGHCFSPFLGNPHQLFRLCAIGIWNDPLTHFS